MIPRIIVAENVSAIVTAILTRTPCGERSSLFLIIVRNKTRLNEPLGILHSCLSLSMISLYEDIWKEWAMSEDSSSLLHVSVICHAKFPQKVTSEWLKQRMLVHPPVMGRGRKYEPPQFHSRRPQWGSIEITRAMLDLVHEGLKIGVENKERDARFSINRYHVGKVDGDLPPVDKFIFVSETCLPVTTLKEVETALFGTTGDLFDVSWVNGRNTPNNGYSRQLQFEKIDPVVPKACQWKADQWMALSRPHAVAIMDLDRHLPRGAFLWQCFDETSASDELYFPTALSLLGIMPSSAQLERRCVTYADWSVSAKNPASFSKGVEDLKRVAALAREKGCLFARKFTPWEVNANTGDAKDGPGFITAAEWKGCIDELVASGDSIEESSQEIVAQAKGAAESPVE